MPKRQRSPDRLPDTERLPLPGRDELAIGADAADVRRAGEWLEQSCRARNVPQALVDRLALCLHEVLANVITHGGETARSALIEVCLEVRLESGSSCAAVTVSDAGVPFNPLQVVDKPLPAELSVASVGGLGLVMVRRCSDWIDYRHEAGRNQVTFGARWSA